jgi:hypothetical protein
MKWFGLSARPVSFLLGALCDSRVCLLNLAFKTNGATALISCHKVYPQAPASTRSTAPHHIHG